MNDTLMRQWAMLRAIPRYPRRIDAPTIHARLGDLGMVVSLRTVQRDLNAMDITGRIHRGHVVLADTVAAENGDTDAMLRLIEEHDRGDLARCWTWVYLSRLVGTDLSKDAYYAINEDGSDYDDDVGGPAYAAGRDGIDLAPISAEQDAAAKQAAQGLFEQIQRAAAVEPRRYGRNGQPPGRGSSPPGRQCRDPTA